MHKTAELKEETDKYNIIILPDFSTPTEHYIEEIKYQQGYRRIQHINQIDLVDIYRTFHPLPQYIYFF